MTEDNIERITNMNDRLLLVMGFATSVILELRHYSPEPEKKAYCGLFKH